MEVGGQRHVPATSALGKTRYPLYRRLGGPQGQSGWVRKILPPPGFNPWTVQLVANCYPGPPILPSRSVNSHSTELQWVCESTVWGPWQFLTMVSMKISLLGYHTGSSSWSRSAWPSTWWHYDPLQCQEIHAQWQSITTHKAWIFSSTATKTFKTCKIVNSYHL